MKKHILVISLIFGVLGITGACRKTDLAGKWEITLKWDERSVFGGAPPAPTVLTLEFKEGKVFNEEEEVGYYMNKTGTRVRIRPAKMKIICYGNFLDENHMEGDINYFPSSEVYGTWTAKRLDIPTPKE